MGFFSKFTDKNKETAEKEQTYTLSMEDWFNGKELPEDVYRYSDEFQMRLKKAVLEETIKEAGTAYITTREGEYFQLLPLQIIDDKLAYVEIDGESESRRNISISNIDLNKYAPVVERYETENIVKTINEAIGKNCYISSLYALDEKGKTVDLAGEYTPISKDDVYLYYKKSGKGAEKKLLLRWIFDIEFEEEDDE